MKRQAKADHCPSCGIKLDKSKDARFVPFCSKRCQMVDLGKWFQEEYSIPTAEQADESEIATQENDHE